MVRQNLIENNGTWRGEGGTMGPFGPRHVFLVLATRDFRHCLPGIPALYPQNDRYQ